MSRLKKIIRGEVKKCLGEQINLNPHANSKDKSPLIYLSMSKNYAMAYANGLKSAAHAYQAPVKNGLIFYVCLDEVDEHYGGDVWLGFKDDIVNDLKEYMENNDYSKFAEETKDFIFICGIDDLDELSVETVSDILEHIKADDLSIISPIDWSLMQNEYIGYSEICLRNMPHEIIVKIEIYKNEVLIDTIKVNIDYDCDDIFYHGSPLENWHI